MGVTPGNIDHKSQNSVYYSGSVTSFFAWKAVLNINSDSSVRHFNWEISPYYLILKINKIKLLGFFPIKHQFIQKFLQRQINDSNTVFGFRGLEPARIP